MKEDTKNKGAPVVSYPYTVTVLDKTRKTVFTKGFSSPYLADKFLKKLRYSKELSVVSYFKSN